MEVYDTNQTYTSNVLTRTRTENGGVEIHCFIQLDYKNRTPTYVGKLCQTRQKLKRIINYPYERRCDKKPKQ